MVKVLVWGDRLPGVYYIIISQGTNSNQIQASDGLVMTRRPVARID